MHTCRYAFGIVLWELYTAEQPFKGVQRVVLAYKIAQVCVWGEGVIRDRSIPHR